MTWRLFFAVLAFWCSLAWLLSEWVHPWCGPGTLVVCGLLSMCGEKGKTSDLASEKSHSRPDLPCPVCKGQVRHVLGCPS